MVDGSRHQQPLVLLTDLEGTPTWVADEPGDAAALVTEVAAALAQTSPGQLLRVVACSGPGSYMGVRAGLAAALGVAQARALPLALVSSLELVQARVVAGEGALLAVLDAGRGGTYGQVRRGHGPHPVAAALLGREQYWPAAWLAAQVAAGTLGEGRLQPPGPRWLEPVRSLASAWAMVAAAHPGSSDYDRVAAEYPTPVGDA